MCYDEGNIYFLAPATMAEVTNDSLNPALQEKQKAMRENIQAYPVVSGDTVSSIAQKYGIEDYHDLLVLNRIMNNELKVRGKNDSNILIKP